METSFYVIMALFGGVSVMNMCTAIAQKNSKARTFSLWLNGLALALIIIALIIALIIK